MQAAASPVVRRMHRPALGCCPGLLSGGHSRRRGNRQRHGDLDKVVAGAMHPADSENNLAVFSEVEDARIAGHSAFLGAQET